MRLCSQTCYDKNAAEGQANSWRRAHRILLRRAMAYVELMLTAPIGHLRLVLWTSPSCVDVLVRNSVMETAEDTCS